MVDIEPYQYQKVTNVKEHNDIVAKINEIVDVLNNSGADTLGPRIDKLETDVSAIDSAVKIQYQDIASIKNKDQAQDTNIGTLDAQVKGITESLISDVNIIDGTTTGKFKVRLDREKAPSIDSNDYDLQKATSIELIQGSGPSMLKAQITLSDGTILISDDFLFTSEAIGTDVYISSFVFKNGNVAGTISADIGLSNGSTLEANNFVVPMDPSLVNTVQDLSTRLTAVEGGSVAGFKELEAQVNTNKTNIATLTTEIDDLDIKKADQSNSNQEIVAGTITATNITKVNVATVNDIPDISGKVDISQGVANAGKPLIVGDNGNVTIGEMPDTGLPSPYMGRITELPSPDYTGSFYLREDGLKINIDMIDIFNANGNTKGFENRVYLFVPKPTTTSSTQITFNSIPSTNPDMAKIINNIIDYFRKLKVSDGIYIASLMTYNDYLKGFFNRYNTSTNTSHEITINVSGDSITTNTQSFIFPISTNDTYIDVYIGNIRKQGY